MHAIPVSAVEQLRLQNKLLQQPVPQLISLCGKDIDDIIVVIYPFEIPNVYEWKSINLARNYFSAKGKHVISLLTIVMDPACPAGAVLLVWLLQACCYPVF